MHEGTRAPVRTRRGPCDTPVVAAAVDVDVAGGIGAVTVAIPAEEVLVNEMHLQVALSCE